MKRTATALLPMLALAGLTFACASGNPQPSETYTNVEAETDLGHSLTGEVVRVDDDAVVVRTATGEETIQIEDATTGRTMLTVGHRVTVHFNRSAQGHPIATRIEHAAPDTMD